MSALSTTKLAELTEQLSGSSRRGRQDAAEQLAQEVTVQPEAMVAYIPDFVDALYRPESQTRWECLDILTALSPLSPEACAEALDGAELALFDEDNSMVRLAALRFLCEWGKMTPQQSAKAWPLIDEAIRCYHGDAEFQDILNIVIGFTGGDLSPQVKKALSNTMAYDAANARGFVQRKAQRIIDNLK